MKRIVFLLLLVSSALGAESKGPFYSPITGFSAALLPILNGFEKANMETTLRGFIARADSFPGYRKSDMEPSEYGLYLNVAVRDADEVKGFSDHADQKGTVTYRSIQIPPPKTGELAIVIELDYGSQAPTDVIRAIDTCIGDLVAFSKQSAKP